MNLDTFFRMTAHAIYCILAGVGGLAVLVGVLSPETRRAGASLLAAICAVSIVVGIIAGLGIRVVTGG